MRHFAAIREFKLVLQCGNAQFGSKSKIFFPLLPWIWQITLKNHRAPLLCYFKPCASFHSHLLIQTEVTGQKLPNWCKICFDLCDLGLWPLTLAFSMDIKFVNGNNPWKFHDDRMRETLWKMTDGRTERSVLRAAHHWCIINCIMLHLIKILLAKFLQYSHKIWKPKHFAWPPVARFGPILPID